MVNWQTSAGDFGRFPRIDLYRERRDVRHGILHVSRRRLAGLIAISLAMAALCAPLAISLFHLQTMLTRKERENAALARRCRSIALQSAQADSQLAGWTQSEQMHRRRDRWRQVLAAVIGAAPPSVCLSDVQLDEQGTHLVLLLHGQAETGRDVQGFLTTIAATNAAGKPQLRQTKEDSTLGPKGVSFEIGAEVSQP